jgi:hypothetical protein
VAADAADAALPPAARPAHDGQAAILCRCMKATPFQVEMPHTYASDLQRNQSPGDSAGRALATGNARAVGMCRKNAQTRAEIRPSNASP